MKQDTLALLFLGAVTSGMVLAAAAVAGYKAGKAQQCNVYNVGAEADGMVCTSITSYEWRAKPFVGTTIPQ